MSVTFSVSSSAPARARADVLAVPVHSGPDLGAAEVLEEHRADLAPLLERADFTGKAGQALFAPLPGLSATLLLVGMGPRSETTLDTLRTAGALVAQRARGAKRVATTLADARPEDASREDAIQALVEGVLLGAYEFNEFRSKVDDRRALRQVVLLGGAGERAKRAVARGEAVAEAVCWARDAVNTPAGQLSPTAFAKRAQTLLRGRGVRVEVLDVAALRRARCGGILGVGQGSEQPPRLLTMTYSPRGARETIALVGKGVVFDSGGLSLKTGTGMETMKTDMAGAAAVIAAMSTLAALGVRRKVVAFAPLVENMPSGSAIRPGDVLTFRNGKTAEVLNTDAEGRLILADALSLAAEGAPDLMVDLATLTGACVVALGEKVAGLMGNDPDVRARVEAAAARAGESVWPLPLPKRYRKLLDSEVADMKNISGGSYGGALTAGLFLEEFVGGVPWAHLDIAGPARAGADDGYTRRGGTGFGVRTLVELVTE